MQSKAPTVQAYLNALPPDRRAAIRAVREVILANLDAGYEEGMQYGMIGYFVPHRVFPDGYHCDPKQPLPFVALASQKNAMSLYLLCSYGDTQDDGWFRVAWARTGKRLNMGKSCIRFKSAEDLALDVIGEAIRRVPAKTLIKQYREFLAQKAVKPRPTAAAARTKKGSITRRSTARNRRA